MELSRFYHSSLSARVQADRSESRCANSNFARAHFWAAWIPMDQFPVCHFGPAKPRRLLRRRTWLPWVGACPREEGSAGVSTNRPSPQEQPPGGGDFSICANYPVKGGTIRPIGDNRPISLGYRAHGSTQPNRRPGRAAGFSTPLVTERARSILTCRLNGESRPSAKNALGREQPSRVRITPSSE
jgi:hypothetical protein